MKTTRLLAVSLACAAGVFAPGASNAAPPTPREVAEALIKAAKAEDLFTVYEGKQLAAVRNTRSGVVCLFFPGASGNNIILKPPTGPARGDDFSCATTAGSMNIHTLAARYGPDLTLDRHIANFSAATARALAPATVQLGPAKGGDHPMAIFTVTGASNGKPMNAFFVAGQINGWTYSVACVAPPSDDANCRSVVADTLKIEVGSISAATNSPARPNAPTAH